MYEEAKTWPLLYVSPTIHEQLYIDNIICATMQESLPVQIKTC